MLVVPKNRSDSEIVGDKRPQDESVTLRPSLTSAYNEMACVLVSIQLTGICYALQLGTSVIPVKELCLLLGLSLFLLVMPRVIFYFVPSIVPPAATLISCGSFIIVAAITPSAIAPQVVNVLAFIGVLAAASIAVQMARNSTFRCLVSVVAVSILLTICVAGQVWKSGYRNPFLFEHICATGSIKNQDPLFHSAVIGMIESYGIPSTGVDGIPFMPYHFGTHWILAQLARFVGIPHFIVIHLIFPIICVPLILLAALYLVQSVKATYANRPPEWGALPTLREQMLLVVGLGGFLPAYVLSTQFFYWGGLFMSESQTIGQLVLFLVLGVSIPLVKRGFEHDVVANGETIRWKMAYLTLFFATGVLTMLKVTISHLVLLSFIYLAVRVRSQRLRLVICCISAAAPIALLSTLTTPHLESDALRIAPFQQWLKRVPAAAWPDYILVNGALGIVYLGLRCSHLQLQSVIEFVEAARNRRLIDAELVILLSMAGMGSTILLGGYMGFNSVYYQTTVQTLCIFLTVGALGYWEELKVAYNTHNWRSYRISFLGLQVLLAMTAATGMINSLELAKSGLWLNVQSRGESIAIPLGMESKPGAIAMRDVLRRGDVREFARLVAENTRRTEDDIRAGDKAVMGQLATLGRSISLTQKSRTAIWIPKTNRGFWDLAPHERRFIPLIAPALSGMAMIDGLPEENTRRDYGYYAYAQIVSTSADALTREAVINRARQSNFEYVIELAEGCEPHWHWCGIGEPSERIVKGR